MTDHAILESPFVETLAEPCTGFTAGESGSPVCGGCGWLDHEHMAAVPEPRRPRVRRAGARRPMAAAS